jgi:excisionase family DNA binding protein
MRGPTIQSVPPARDDEITIAAAARRLGLSQHTVEALIGRGEMAGEVTVPTDRPRQRRRIRLRRTALDEYLDRVKPGELRHLYPEWSWERIWLLTMTSGRRWLHRRPRPGRRTDPSVLGRRARLDWADSPE